MYYWYQIRKDKNFSEDVYFALSSNKAGNAMVILFFFSYKLDILKRHSKQFICSLSWYQNSPWLLLAKDID